MRISVRSRAAHVVATGFGVGRIPWAPGTAGSLLGLALWWWPLARLSLPLYGLGLTAAFCLGVGVCGRAARDLRTSDPAMVVWDEVVGMGVALMGVPARPLWGLAAFALFRAFDIAKPYPIRALERWPGGLGIMADDVLAGVYARAVLAVGGWWLSAYH